MPKSVNFHTYKFQDCVNFRKSTQNLETFFIKRTTSGKPPVGSKRYWDSYFRSNKQELYVGYYGRPCTNINKFIIVKKGMI